MVFEIDALREPAFGDELGFGFFEFVIRGREKVFISRIIAMAREEDVNTTEGVPAFRADLLCAHPPPNGIDDSRKNIQKPHENLNHQQSAFGINGITLATAFHTNVFPGEVDTTHFEMFFFMELLK